MRPALLLILISGFITARAQPPIGSWREHLPYNSTIDVTAGGGKVYAATPYSLFSVGLADNIIERYSRVSGLNETGISTIGYDATTEKLFIAYSNSNIDFLYRNGIFNVPDIKRSTIAGDKTIYRAYPQGKNWYLSTGIGVIVVDAEKYEVKDSWFIGAGGSHVKVNGFAADASFFYAATEEGLKRAQVGSNNPADHNNWQLITGPGLSAGACQHVFLLQNRVIVQKSDSLFAWNGTTWNLLYRDGWPIISAHVSADKILLSERFSNGPGRVVILNGDGTVARTLPSSPAVSFPRKAILVNNEPWVADQFGGLSHHSASGYEQYKPNSPEATGSGEMLVFNNVLYAAAGEVNDAWNYQFNGNGVFILRDGSWENINRFRYPKLDSLLDFITVAVDSRDETLWTGSYGGGLLHIKPGPQFDIYKQGFIGVTIGDPGSYRVSGLSFDADHNLWISNYGAAQPLRVRKADGTWTSFTVPFFLNDNAVSQVVIDDANYKWIVSPKGNGLLVYDHGNAIDNIGDDRWKIYRMGAGNGNLPANDITCLAKDRNGFIWVGTVDGIGVIQCPQDAFAGTGCDAIWPVIRQGNFANYLFKGEEVRSIAVDGADRKWVATRNGVWLIDANGEKIIYQFTEDNSPLLSNDVKKIAINGRTGEVFFATLRGICSFRSTATEGGTTNANVRVFPNPVPPGYSGTIAIRGLVNNAIVKITELDGRLVYQTRALGGQAVWDGRDYRGRKISSGVYLVLVSDEERKENLATKIVFVSN